MISSRAVSPGERIEAELVEPVELEDKTQVPAGSKAILRVVDARPGVALGAGAQLLLKVTQLRRSMTEQVEVNTAGLQQDVTEIAAGSVLEFRQLSSSTPASPSAHK